MYVLTRKGDLERFFGDFLAGLWPRSGPFPSKKRVTRVGLG
jgi:hypothetical protein